jgi:uncharacterized protein (DUF302 family)
MSVTDTVYQATRVTYDSARGFAETQSSFDEQVPFLDPGVAVDLVINGASWEQVQSAVNTRIGPSGLVALVRLEQGLLLSLSGEALQASLYLVGNPLVAREVLGHDPAGALYAPFRVAVFADDLGTHISYDKPSTVFASLGSASVDQIAVDLDAKIAAVAERVCRDSR